MAFNTNITPGAPPLLWSDVYEAFKQVNENFDILAATVGGGSGLTPINFETLDTSVSPATSNAYSLGDATHQWKSVYTAEWSSVAGSELNGLWAGSAQIKGIGLTVELPAGSTVDGNLIIDPDKTFFKAAQIDNAESVIANEFSDTLNFISGNGIQLSVDSSAESITIDNTGILSVADGNGISHTTVNGIATITNTGVRSLQSTTSLPSGRIAGAGINIDNTSGDNVKVTNTGILDVQAGFGILVSTDAASGVSTVSFSSGVAPQTAFTRFHIVGDSVGNDITSDSTADTFNIDAGYGILLTNDPGTDTLTIAVNQTIDIYGSVLGKDSTVLVDADAGQIPAEVVKGTFTGTVIGNVTGNLTGTADIATTVTLVATNTTNATHYITFVDTATGNENVKTDTSLTYNPSTNTLTAGTFATGSLTITGSTIGTSDSSGIVVEELTTFNTDVTVENDLIVTQRLTVGGSRVINLTELKSIVAASTDFANFKTRIAALV
jgi:hypothetical protein